MTRISSLSGMLADDERMPRSCRARRIGSDSAGFRHLNRAAGADAAQQLGSPARTGPEDARLRRFNGISFSTSESAIFGKYACRRTPGCAAA
jgi:hypothetical protein